MSVKGFQFYGFIDTFIAAVGKHANSELEEELRRVNIQSTSYEWWRHGEIGKLCSLN